MFEDKEASRFLSDGVGNMGRPGVLRRVSASCDQPPGLGQPLIICLSIMCLFLGQTIVILETLTWFQWARETPEAGSSFQVVSAAILFPHTQASGRRALLR